MRYSYRITKYFTSSNEGIIISNDSEWTSFSDVGFKVSMDDYLHIEKTYLSFITSTCSYLQVDKLQVTELENYHDDKSFVSDRDLTIEDAISIARKVLREEIWCKLVSEDIEFHFGYDYYLYITSNYDLSSAYEKKGFGKVLNIEKIKSPYTNLS